MRRRNQHHANALTQLQRSHRTTRCTVHAPDQLARMHVGRPHRADDILQWHVRNSGPYLLIYSEFGARQVNTLTTHNAQPLTTRSMPKAAYVHTSQRYVTLRRARGANTTTTTHACPANCADGRVYQILPTCAHVVDGIEYGREAVHRQLAFLA